MSFPFRALVVSSSICLLLLMSCRGSTAQTADREYLHAPAGERATHIDPTGETVIPNGRLVTPRGVQVKVAPHPYGIALSPDGKTLVTSNSGTAPFSVSIITSLASQQPEVVQIPPGFKTADADPKSVYLGVAIAPDNHTLYVSEGNNGNVGVFDMNTHQRLASISLDGDFQGHTYAHSLTADLKLNPDGRTLFVLDLAHFRLLAIDTESRRIIASAPTGYMPFALALSPDGHWAYVANVGTFRYHLIPGYDPNNPNSTGLTFPPFGYPSTDATKGGTVEGKQVAGLFDPNTPQSNSVYVLDVSTPTKVEFKRAVRTGVPIGPDSVSGSSPGGVVAGHKKIFVSNAVQDSITIIDAKAWHVEKTVTIEPAPSVKGLRGVLPFGLALSPDEKRLYIACAGINAVAVMDTSKGDLIGYLPSGWFPARVAVSADGKTVYVSNGKGFGAGPNGGPDFREGVEGSYIGDITKGVVSIMPVPTGTDLEAGTAQVLRNNGFVRAHGGDSFGSVPPRPLSQIKHAIFIVKENRTFDQVFGDLPEIHGQKVNAEPELGEFDNDATVRPASKHEEKMGEKVPEPGTAGAEPTVEHAHVTPNEHALAQRFGISDNFYVDSDVSVDGHHWLVGNYPNELLETGWPAGYGNQFDFAADDDAPGRLEVGSSTPWPETYLQAGSLWEHLERHKITFRNYGEGLELAGNDESGDDEPTGIREGLNMPMAAALFQNTDREFPTFNTDISDQYRFQQFKKEFDHFASGARPMPQFMMIWLPDDHTATPRPNDGYPYRASYVADNDYALGRIVELISHSPTWKDTALFVTEDDAQDGTDHVDAHRSLLLVISPYSKRSVSHVHASIASILKTFDEILGLPPLNQYDAAASDLAGLFGMTPDLTPYTAIPPDTRIFDPAKLVDPGLEAIRAGRVKQGEPLDDPARIRKQMQEREGQNNKQ